MISNFIFRLQSGSWEELGVKGGLTTFLPNWEQANFGQATISIGLAVFSRRRPGCSWD
jgi:hypothetical protein